MKFAIECQKRLPGSKPNALRREGKTPAVLYGHKGAESISLTINSKAAELLLKKASLNNTLIQVNIPDLSWSGKALLREVQTHPWKPEVYHLSFFSIGTQESVQVTVPLHLVGESIGVKTYGGTLDVVLTELEVQCAPDLIPETIDIDISDMNVGDALHVGELKLPAGVAAVGEDDRVIVSVLHGSGDSKGVAES
jgi:large subunit ribosomal protein L25